MVCVKSILFWLGSFILANVCDGSTIINELKFVFKTGLNSNNQTIFNDKFQLKNQLEFEN